MRKGRTGARSSEEERGWRLSDLLTTDDLALFDKPGEDLRVMLGCFVEVCKRRDLKVKLC